jgi:hypothetical protein
VCIYLKIERKNYTRILNNKKKTIPFSVTSSIMVILFLIINLDIEFPKVGSNWRAYKVIDFLGGITIGFTANSKFKKNYYELYI